MTSRLTAECSNQLSYATILSYVEYCLNTFCVHTKMERLIELVREIECDSRIQYSEYVSPVLPAVMEIECLAEEVLITEKGACNWPNIRILQTHKIFVFPIERDSFGWLVGGISTTKGIITYG